MTTTPAPLWHYTCEHGRLGIGTRGYLRPGADGFVWLTDLDAPYRDALGLSSVLIACDRTRHRYRIADGADVIPFTDARHTLDPVRWHALVNIPGGMVRHWYITDRRIWAELDER